MKNTFSQSMAWLHTWSGLLLGWVLFAIFLTGSLSVFDREITQWMQPEVSGVEVPVADAVNAAGNYLQQHHADSDSWLIVPPNDRNAAMLAYWQEGIEFPHVGLHPASGEPVTRDTDGGHFFVHFHYQLHAGTIGTWIVGLLGSMMLVGLLTGIVIHKRIFKDFFTFRPRSGAQRSWLDAHNALGVLTLPFLLMITFSGLAIMAFMYVPSPIQTLYGNSLEQREEFFHEALPHKHLEPTGESAPLKPLGGFIEQARAAFGGDPVWYVSVDHPGDRNAVVTIGALNESQVNLSGQLIQFNGVTGEVLQQGMTLKPAAKTQRVLSGLHFAQFGGSITHWLYFLSGLIGTAMIGTGLLLFIVKRRRQLAMNSDVSTGFLNFAERMNVAAIAGPLMGVLVYFWANRLLPLDLSARAGWEIGAFFTAWLLVLLYAFSRPVARAWLELFTSVAALCLALPVLNLLTTNQHLLVTLPAGQLDLAAFDLTCLGFGAGFACLVRMLVRRQAAPAQAHGAPVAWRLAD